MGEVQPVKRSSRRQEVKKELARRKKEEEERPLRWEPGAKGPRSRRKRFRLNAVAPPWLEPACVSCGDGGGARDEETQKPVKTQVQTNDLGKLGEDPVLNAVASERENDTAPEIVVSPVPSDATCARRRVQNETEANGCGINSESALVVATAGMPPAAPGSPATCDGMVAGADEDRGHVEGGVHGGVDMTGREGQSLEAIPIRDSVSTEQPKAEQPKAEQPKAEQPAAFLDVNQGKAATTGKQTASNGAEMSTEAIGTGAPVREEPLPSEAPSQCTDLVASRACREKKRNVPEDTGGDDGKHVKALVVPKRPRTNRYQGSATIPRSDFSAEMARFALQDMRLVNGERQEKPTTSAPSQSPAAVSRSKKKKSKGSLGSAVKRNVKRRDRSGERRKLPPALEAKPILHEVTKMFRCHPQTVLKSQHSPLVWVDLSDIASRDVVLSASPASSRLGASGDQGKPTWEPAQLPSAIFTRDELATLSALLPDCDVDTETERGTLGDGTRGAADADIITNNITADVDGSMRVPRASLFTNPHFRSSLDSFQNLLRTGMFDKECPGARTAVVEHFRQLFTLTKLTNISEDASNRRPAAAEGATKGEGAHSRTKANGPTSRSWYDDLPQRKSKSRRVDVHVQGLMDKLEQKKREWNQRKLAERASVANGAVTVGLASHKGHTNVQDAIAVEDV